MGVGVGAMEPVLILVPAPLLGDKGVFSFLICAVLLENIM